MVNQTAFEAAIKSFNMALVTDAKYEASGEDIQHAMMDAMKFGYVFDPKAYSPMLMTFIMSQSINPNATFYKTWRDVISKTRFELLFDQLMHYMTTYGGLAPERSNGYVPNDTPAVVDYTQYKIIRAGTLREIAGKCLGLVSSGIALGEETLGMCRQFVYDAKSACPNFTVDIDSIKNREFLIWYCDMYKMLPTKPVDILRYFVYKATGSAMLIKSNDALRVIKSHRVSLSALSEKDMEKLSTIFHRFKPIFLAFKHNKCAENVRIVNKIRRLAVKNHVPLKNSVFESLTDLKWNPDEIVEAVKRENVFKIIRGMGMLKSLIENDDSGEYAQTYMIRNGKSYTRGYPGKDVSQTLKDVYTLRYICLLSELAGRMNRKYISAGKKTVLLPDKFDLACPVSERQFIGNMPYGTSYVMKEDNYFGVYWRGEWGTDDYDLSFTSFDGNHLGWNAAYKMDDNALVFSGDMTRAEPEATEMFYCHKTAPDGVLHLNRYSGQRGSRARLFFGSDDLRGKFGRNYMVDPNTIEFTVDMISDRIETNVGCILGGVMYVMDIQTSNRAVAGVDNMSMAILSGIKRKLRSYPRLKTVLEQCGFNVVYSAADAPDGKVDFDFTSVDKDTLIRFFADTAEQDKE